MLSLLRQNWLSAGGGHVPLPVLVALAAPLIAPRDPLKADFRHMNKPPGAEAYFGTDQVGRDALSRVIYGARTSLFVAFSAVLVAIAITRIPFGGRVIRSVALSVSAMPFVEAGRAAGASQLRVMTLHVLPQCVAPYLVLATTHLGVAIVIEPALGSLC